MNTNVRNLWLKCLCIATTLAFCIGILLLTISFAYAEEETPGVTIGEQQITVDTVDPIEVGSDGTVTREAIDASHVVLFTPSYYFMQTPQAGEGEDFTEYAVTADSVHRISEVGTEGGMDIPSPGYVIRIPASKGIAAFEQGTVAVVSGVEIASATVDNLTKGVRVALAYDDGTTLSGTTPGVAYYDTSLTTTIDYNTSNVYVGFEMITKAEGDYTDEQVGQFVAKTFRASGTSASFDVAANGFALAARSEAGGGTAIENASAALLAQDKTFSENDIVTLSGRDYFKLDYSASTDFNYIDPDDTTPGADFPENRGTDMLNIYTKSMEDGGSQLKTNTYGYEAAVDADGYIIKVANNVGDIPEGGYVVSGHGPNRRAWTSVNFQVGYHVTIDEETHTITVTSSLRSVVASMESDLNSYTMSINNYRTRLYDVNHDKLAELLADYTELVGSAVEEGNKIIDGTYTSNEQIVNGKIAIRSALDNSQSISNEIALYSSESLVVEGHTMWHVPNAAGNESTLEGIEGNFALYKELGINSIVVEVTLRGFTFYKGSEYYEYSPEVAESYGEYDSYLDAFMALAEENEMEVHFWVSVYQYGDQSGIAGQEGSLYTKHPEWAAVNPTGETTCSTSGNVWIDPANLVFRDYLLGYVDELLTKYPQAVGVSLDHIRYPNDALFDIGYTVTAMEQFLDRYGYTVAGQESSTTHEQYFRNNFVKLLDTYPQIRLQWDEFRRDCVADMVEAVYDLVQEKFPGIAVSASVATDLNTAINSYLCDWSEWLANGWLDFVMPMSYISGTDAMGTMTIEAMEAANGLADVQMGIGIYNKISSQTMISQISYMKQNGAIGFVLFSSADLINDEKAGTGYIEALKAIYGNSSAVSPNASAQTIANAVFNAILGKADRLYIPAEQMTAEQKASLKAEFDKILAMPMGTAEELNAVYNAVTQLQKNVNTYASRYAAQRVSDGLDEILNNFEMKINRLLINSGEWDPATETRPSFGTVTVPDVEPFEDPAIYTPAGLNAGHYVMIVVAVLALAAAVAVVAIKVKRR